MTEEEEAHEAKAQALLRQTLERAIALRNKDREFHGLEREFGYHQAQLLLEFQKSKDIGHPRDVGDVRETILRRYLSESGYLPTRYGVSDRSVRAVSTSGHISNELDIMLLDPTDSVTLMRREDTYAVYPIESAYGAIQVKSRLNKKEIREGLANIASFKSLARAGVPRGSHDADHGFGLLFAYDTDLAWIDVCNEIEAFAKANPQRVWANAIFILSKGFFLHGQDNKGFVSNQEIEGIETLRMFGVPDREGICLFQFQGILLGLLRGTATSPAQIERYFRLPLVADTHSYAFSYGAFAEVGECPKHGPYQRKISAENLQRLIDWCKTATPLNWIEAVDQAYGQPRNEAAYRRQPGDVYVYNPEGLPLSDILLRDAELGGKMTKTLAFDSVQVGDMIVYVPYRYSGPGGIVSECPKCKPR